MLSSPQNEVSTGRRNMAEISAQLGVSVSTVSRALRNADGVDAKTRARVVAEAERVGYVGAPRANGLRSTPRTLLFLSVGHSGHNESGMMAGMSRAAVLGNLSIVAHQVPAHEMESILDPRRQPPAMRMGQVDGILVAQGWDAGVVEELLRGHAVVSVHERYEGCDFVGADLADAVVRLASEIPDRSPGFFCASSEAEEHLWEEICAAAGVRMGRPSVMDRLVTTSLADGKSASDSGAGSWQEKMGALASAGVRSWICADAASAKNLFGHLAAIGGCPPDVLAIVQPGPASGLPGNILRTGPDAGEIGMAAVRRLVRRIEMPDEPVRSILLQSKTVIREGQA